MKKDIVKSSIITFLATFILAIVPFLGNVSFEQAAIVAAVMTALRTAIKVTVEYILAKTTLLG